MSRFLTLLVFLAAALFSLDAQAQVRSSADRPLFLSVYGTASGSEHELHYGHALGGGAGLILERSPLLALDVRAVALRYRVPLHTYLLEAGPRVSRTYHGRLQFYGEVMTGLGRSGYLEALPGTLKNPLAPGAYGWAWTLNAGLDLRLTEHLAWRVGEYSYNRIYVSPNTPVAPGVSTTTKSAIGSLGAVYRF